MIEKPDSRTEADAKFQQAFALHEQGRLGEARSLYEQALQLQPEHFDAWHLMGVLAAQAGDPQRAVESIAKAIAIDPKNPAAHNNQGNALRELGRHAEAVRSYEQAISLEPRSALLYFNRGNSLTDCKRYAEAVASYDQAIALEPGAPEIHYSRGIVLLHLGQYEAAVQSHDLAIALDPDFAEAYGHRGHALAALKRYEAAVQSYDRAIALKPDDAGACNKRGILLAALRRHQEAIRSYDQAIALDPGHADAHHNRGVSLYELGRCEEAIQSCDQAILLKPDYSAAHGTRGNALAALGRHDAALRSYDRAIALAPGDANAYDNRGISLARLKRYEEAIQSYDRAIALKPDYANAYNNRGVALVELKRYDEAVQSYDRAVALQPDLAEARRNRGHALFALMRYEAAIRSFDQALALKPADADAYNVRGIAFGELKLHDEAIRSFDRALALQPDYAEAYGNRASSLAELKQFEAAIQSYDRAIALNPENVEAHHNRGNALRELKQYEAAIASYDRAIAIKPDRGWVYGDRAYAKLLACDWADLDRDIALLREKIERGEKAAAAFIVLATVDSPASQRKAAEIFAKEHCSVAPLPGIAKRANGNKIRLAYFSADFRDHPVSYLTAGLFEAHDRSRFEVTAFSIGPETQDAMRRRLERAFDQFVDVRGRSDEDVALLARSMQIDIAVDLGGFTGGCRPRVFALRAAPLQANFLGFAGTMGVEFMDYLVADATLIPAPHRGHYAEKIAYLPSYQPNDSTRRIADREFTREELGLPRTGFVFCCFNNSYKLTPTNFDAWMRILKRVDDSVLWLSGTHEAAERNLRKEASARGVAAERLIFARRLPSAEEHLARQRAADLFLDTLPYNAHTTASDALWAGLPVLTRLGDTFAGRVAASLLNAINLPELITSTPQQYEDLAVELAGDPERLAGIRRKLVAKRVGAPLFDTRLYTRCLEASYTKMYDRYQAGLPPEHLEA